MRSANELLGVSGAKLGDLIDGALLAFVICFVAAAAGATIVLGMHIRYRHVDHMADKGLVLRSRKIGEGLGAKTVEEWVKMEEKTE